MEDIFQTRLKDHEAHMRAKSRPSNTSSETSSQYSRNGSIDLPSFREKGGMEDDDYSFSDYSFYSGIHEKEKQLPRMLPGHARYRVRRLLVIVTGFGFLGFAVIVWHIFIKGYSQKTTEPRALIHQVESNNAGRRPYFSNMYEVGKAGPGVFPSNVQSSMTYDFCSICNCDTAPAFYSPSPVHASQFSPRPEVQDVYGPKGVDINEFMRLTILDMYCARQHLSNQQALKLLRRSINHMEEMMSWSLGSLELGKPTIYLTTATSPNSKAGPIRPQYFRRHGRAIRTWMKQQETKAKEDHPGWQVVWILAEDEVDIDPQVVRTLRRTGIPYIYLAYGLTQSWGNAQKNAAMQIVYALSRSKEHGGLMGHGPVYGLDDDNKILSDILGVLTRVNRVGVFPMGNLGADGWEEPIVDEMGLVIESGSLWQPEERLYPFDYGGFSFNSSLLGTTISGPMFWKHTDFAGESEFLTQIIGNIKDLEPLCGRTPLQECHSVWHNEPLTEIEMMTDDEEVAYVKKFGVEQLFRMQQQQARDRDQRRAEEYLLPDDSFPPESLPGEFEEIVWVEVDG